MRMVTTQERCGVPAGNVLAWGLILTAWALAGVTLLTGHEELIDHDVLVGEGRLPGPDTLLLFLAVWQVMTAAMMLPSSLPMVRLFARASKGQAHPNLALGIFLAAYFAVWSGFALAALLADSGLHILSDQWAWLGAHPQLISGSVLLLAGGFQFSPLKERCLTACRSPMSFLWQHYRRGTRGAWSLGIRHGLFCLGCCWALMLVMFALGVSSLVWMSVLTGVMVIEKTTRWGRQLVPYVGMGLIGLGILVMV